MMFRSCARDVLKFKRIALYSKEELNEVLR